jgi:hypothetical protein
MIVVVIILSISVMAVPATDIPRLGPRSIVLVKAGHGDLVNVADESTSVVLVDLV